MPDTSSRANGERVLADLNALRAIGAYKTGVHKPTFSEPHKLSLDWLVQKLPDAGPHRRDRRHRQCLRHQRKAGTQAAGGIASRKPELRRLARRPARRRLRARSGPRAQCRSLARRRGRSCRLVRRGRTFWALPRLALLCRTGDRGRHRCRARPHQRPHHAGRTRRHGARRTTAHRRRAGPARRISGSAYRAGRHARKRPPCDRRRHLHRRHLAIPDQFRRRAEPRRHHPHGAHGRMPGWRWQSSASRSTSVSPIPAARARSGPPAASRSIRARRASFRARPKCCSRSATTIQR